MVHVLLRCTYENANVHMHNDTWKLLRRLRISRVETNIGRGTNKREKIRYKHLDYITLFL